MRRIAYNREGNKVGYFHGFMQDYQGCESGPGNYPVAIIEEEDGSIILEYAGYVQLLDRPVAWADLYSAEVPGK